MSMRRPRIKVAAILPPKRPARETSAAGTAPKQPKIELKSEPEPELKSEPKQLEEEKVQAIVLESTDKPDCPSDSKPIDLNATTTKPAEQEVVPVTPQEHIDLNDNDIFKSPPMVANHKRTESFSTSDIECDRVEDFYQKGSQGPPSPVKVRQRIRPTPFFGMRRNSLQGYGSDMEDEPRRQRHTSTSSNTGPPTPQRIRPPNIQRIRTESSCSNMSDFGRDQNARTPRKQEDSPRTYTPRKDILVRFRCKVIEKASLKMSDLIYYNPSSNPMVAADPPPTASPEEKPKVEVDVKPLPEKPIEPLEKQETAMPVPQLKLGPDGEMILDEQSLVIETTAEKEARETLANTKVIYMDEFSGNSGFYRRNKRTKDWPPEETIKFYRCLHTVGTDFSLMLSLFPNRSRRDLKLKFKKEEKTNLALVNKALLYPNTFNVAELKQELEKDQEILDAKKKELEEIYRKKAEITTAKKKVKPYRCYSSRSGNVLRGGDLVYDNEVVSPPSKELNETKPAKKERKKSGKQKKVAAEDDNTEEKDTEVDVKDKENKKSNKKQKEEKKKVKKENEEKKNDKTENKGKKKDRKGKNADAPQDIQDPDAPAKFKHEIFDDETDTIPIVFENTFNETNGDDYVPQDAENTPRSNDETVLFEFTTEPLITTKLENYKIINCGAIIPSEYCTSLSDSSTLFNPKLEDGDGNCLDVSHTVEIDPAIEDESLSQHTQEDGQQIGTGAPDEELGELQHMIPDYVSQVPVLCEAPNAVDLILSNSLLYKDTTESIKQSFTKTEIVLGDDPNESEYGAESPSYEMNGCDDEISSGNIEQNDSTHFVKEEMQAHVQKTEASVIDAVEETPHDTSEIAAIYKTDNREDDHLIGQTDEQYAEDANELLLKEDQLSVMKEDTNELSVVIEDVTEKFKMKEDQQPLEDEGSIQSKEESEYSSNETHQPEEEKNEESLKDIDAEMERFMHNDLGTILTNLINGSLVVVSSEDENIPDKIVNEIYVMDKETGSLSDRPLDLPEDIVNCIVEELNAS